MSIYLLDTTLGSSVRLTLVYTDPDKTGPQLSCLLRTEHEAVCRQEIQH